MGNYAIFGGFENPRRGRQATNLTTKVPKILDLKSSSEEMFLENCRWVPLIFVAAVDVSKVAFIRSKGVNVTGGSDVSDIQL